MSGFLLLCGVGFAAFASYEWARTPLTPLLGESLGASPEAIGSIMAVSTAVGILVKLPAGVLSDTLGRKWVILSGVGFFALTPFLYAGVHSAGALLAVRLIHGLATALYTPAAMAAVADVFGRRRGEGIGWYTACTQTGKSIGPAIGGFALSHVGFGSSYLLCGVSGLAALGLALVFVARTGRGSQVGIAPGSSPMVVGAEVRRRLIVGVKELSASPKVVVTCLAQSLQLFALGSLQAFLPLLAASRGVAVELIGLFFTVKSVASLMARPIAGRLSDRIGRTPMLVAGMIVSAAALYALPFSAATAPIILVALVYGLGDAVTHTASAAQVADLSRTQSLGAAMGLFGSLTDVGHAAGQFLMGFLVAWMGFVGAYHSVAGLLLFGAAVVWWTFRSRRPSLRPA
ncbi:MAG: MFS transporter [Nitrospirae bacterium]|nr:MFS transporter [Nitrospirota bacterium]